MTSINIINEFWDYRPPCPTLRLKLFSELKQQNQESEVGGRNQVYSKLTLKKTKGPFFFLPQISILGYSVT
jgi:hypothetical protein